MTDSREKALKMVSILDEKKARDIKLLNVHDQTILADYFVIAEGTSTTHVNSLADELEYKLSTEYGLVPSHTEGANSGVWILMDYDNVIVHIFNRESRSFYKLDKLWSQGEEVELELKED